MIVEHILLQSAEQTTEVTDIESQNSYDYEQDNRSPTNKRKRSHSRNSQKDNKRSKRFERLLTSEH
jgi:hypothetical protein